MSLRAETFYALQCDFPECGELWEGYEFTYYADGPDASDAEEDGWLVDHDSREAYCSLHVIEIDCPPEAFATAPDGARYCQWCEDRAQHAHLAPMPDTVENRLRWRLDRVVNRAHMDLDRLERKVCDSQGSLGEHGHNARVLDQKLIAIWERTCREWKPDITHQELRNLRYPSDHRDGGFTGNQLGSFVLDELRANLYPESAPRRSFFSFPRRSGKRTIAALAAERQHLITESLNHDH